MHAAFKMHFRCELRCVCAVGYLPRQDCIYRDMEYLKFGLMFDLNFFHKLDLYQDNKSLLNLRFQCFLIPRIYYLCQFWRKNNLVHRFKILWGGPSPFWDLGDIEPFYIPWIHQENVKNMQIINYKIYVDSCYYTVHKFRKSIFKSNGPRYFKALLIRKIC